MAVKLVHTDTKRSDGVEIRKIITVDYDPKEHTADLISVTFEDQRYFEDGNTINYSSLSTEIDVTPFYDDSPALLREVMGMDWETVYREHLYDEGRISFEGVSTVRPANPYTPALKFIASLFTENRRG